LEAAVQALAVQQGVQTADYIHRAGRRFTG
jgi:hypothetical protein